MSRLFQYRFPDGGGLQGHSFGNLFMAALAEVTGDFELAVQESTHVLKVRGRVLPSTLADVVLHAQLEGGGQVSGESTITAADRLPRRVWITPEAPARPAAGALGAAPRRCRRARSGQSLHEHHPQPAHPRGARRDQGDARLGPLRLQRHDPGRRDRRLHGRRPSRRPVPARPRGAGRRRPRQRHARSRPTWSRATRARALVPSSATTSASARWASRSSTQRSPPRATSCVTTRRVSPSRSSTS